MAKILSLHESPLEVAAAFLGTRLSDRLGPIDVATLHRDDITMAPIGLERPRLHIADDIHGRLYIAAYPAPPTDLTTLATKVAGLFMAEELPGMPAGDTRPTVRMLLERASPILDAHHARVGELLRFIPVRQAMAA